MTKKIDINYSLKNHRFAGETLGTKSTVYLPNIDNHAELLTITVHEIIHAVFDVLGIDLTQKQEHYIIKRLDTEWF